MSPARPDLRREDKTCDLREAQVDSSWHKESSGRVWWNQSLAKSDHWYC